MSIPQTETPSNEHADLDLYDAPTLVAALIADQARAASAVAAAQVEIAAAVSAAVPRIEAGGRLIYVGAGTSGRLGLLDSVELFPTFSWPHERALALLAGGPSAIYQAVEGAEDDAAQGASDVLATKLTAQDVVIVLAASGATPYALGAVGAARGAGALTIGIANNPGSPLAAAAECPISLNTGAEVISGSTRLKAGTAQKIVLNTLSSAIMVRLNKVYGNLMVDVKPTNTKLVRRAIRLTVLATNADETTARAALEAADFQVKVAIVAIRAGCDEHAAREKLAAVGGSVRRALGE